jgi:alpha-L-fucosidase
MGDWFKAVREAFYGVEPCADLTENGHILLTRRGSTLYVIAHKPPVTNAVRLKPIAAEPLSATLLNDGREVEWLVNRVPGYGPGVDSKPFLRLRELPVNELAGQLLVIKLEFKPEDMAAFTRGHQGTGTEREFSADAYE